ncbi:MAG: inosine monophosphate cyclohydrolase [Armatimonadetes bacterium]|nr:inosine monophosphate cyclohydrolase [Armatimonadota bacterium]
MDLQSAAETNLEALSANPYPGRGIVLGRSPNGRSLVQVYWIMGRSEGSRNRVFVAEDGFLKTRLWDESKATDPTLLIYYPMKHIGSVHVVSNGDQTDTILEALRQRGTFESALDTRTFEPDPPIHTPRISGLMDIAAPQEYKLSVLKPMSGDPDSVVRCFYNFATPAAGVGNCIHTYWITAGGQPVPFVGEPYLLPLFDDIDETAGVYWDALDEDNRVSIAVKFIDIVSGKFELRINNKHG